MRFPSRMWRNADVLDFVGWLRAFNEQVASETRVGFYGLDLYSLHASVEAVLSYLGHADPAAAARARERYACFEQFGADPQWYGRAATLGRSRHCEDEVVAQLGDLFRQRELLLRRDGVVAEDEYFQAEQNARVVQSAEQYYRTMFGGRMSSWNLRDRHMADTLDALAAHLGRRRRRPRVVVWAHNSHLGDARATEMGRAGELNLGQLVRERHPGEAVLIGFSTYEGTVTAASDWGEPAERKQVRPGLPGSWEELFHGTGVPDFLLIPREAADVQALGRPLLQRAIGVVYRPQTERQSHYFRARLPDQFDAVFHLDRTRALEPLERSAAWERGEVPETYPSGV
jgi:erythromycin esterase-like protein